MHPQHKTIETITCLSKSGFSTNNYTCLYGLHEKFLKDLGNRLHFNFVLPIRKLYKNNQYYIYII